MKYAWSWINCFLWKNWKYENYYVYQRRKSDWLPPTTSHTIYAPTYFHQNQIHRFIKGRRNTTPWLKTKHNLENFMHATQTKPKTVCDPRSSIMINRYFSIFDKHNDKNCSIIILICLGSTKTHEFERDKRNNCIVKNLR